MVPLNGETVFITGGSPKHYSYIGWGLGCLSLGIILTAVTDAAGFPVLFYGLIIWGILYTVMFFVVMTMHIAVSNYRVTGKCFYRKVDISLGSITDVNIQPNGSLAVKYFVNRAQKTAVFPKMENTQQIYNAIYSLVFTPPPAQH